MVDMGVAQHHRIQFGRVEWELPVALHRFVSFALEESAFEQNPLLIDFKQIHRAGGGPRRCICLKSIRSGFCSNADSSRANETNRWSATGSSHSTRPNWMRWC